MPLDVHIVTHTHWDREWYLPLERFRQRLVALVDELIDDPPSGDESFLLDGQAIVVEDYLTVRPDRANELEAMLRDGRIEAGPWYVLADELIPGGEALVRNLLTGRRLLRRRSAAIPAVLYCPDSFGHPASLPSIAAGFGFPLIVLWRGYGGARWPEGDTVRWLAPGGDEALVFHLSRDGYEFGSHLPLDANAADARWRRMRAELSARSTTGVFLIPNGADHHARQRGFRDTIAALEHAGAEDDVHRSSLSQFARHLVQRATAQRLPVIQGELRDSYGYTWTLQGTFATRAHEKRLNARAERLLVREAEPWHALAAVRSSRGHSLLDEAWRTLLTAHPHDTLCGCSIDEVALAMEQRITSAINQAQGIRDDAIETLVGYDAAASREARDHWRSTVVVRNAAPRPRGGVALLEIEEFVADVPVGPGSAPTPEKAEDVRAAASVSSARTGLPPAFASAQVLSRAVTDRRVESPRHYPDNDRVRVTRVVAWLAAVPAYGVSCIPLDAEPERGLRVPDRVVATKRGIRNAHLTIEIDARGAITLSASDGVRRIESLLEIVDEADVGDLYTPAPRERPHAVKFLTARATHRGPLRGEIELRYQIVDGSSSRRRIDAELRIRVSLDAGAPFLRIEVDGENRREDHRVRLRVRTDVRGAEVWADAAFATVRRIPIDAGASDRSIEIPPPTAPLHRYVSRFGNAGGATVFSDGLAEYEAEDDGSILVTLMRAVAELSRNDIPERPGHAGWPTPTPGAQCRGPFTAGLALMLHGPRTAATIDAIERVADDVLLPLTGVTLRAALSTPAPIEGVELQGIGLAFSAMKTSEDGEWLTLRCVNHTDAAVSGAWQLPFAPSEARLARLDETTISNLECEGCRLFFDATARAIVTILVR